ncbi:MAG: Flp pilus assembly complex ATPase component TadA [Candidatus Tectomicrobia bacterium]|nr:Flp pilus assembly complex ATPase component TadA [Candidatus Tectomicrobia bacterium]
MSTLEARLGEILLAQGHIDEKGLRQGLEVQQVEGGRLGEILCRLGLLRPENLASSLGIQFGRGCRPEIALTDVDRDLLRAIPYAFARRYGVVPVRSNGGGPRVVVADPSDLNTLADLRLLLECEFEVDVAPAHVIESVVDRAYEHRESRRDESSEKVRPAGDGEDLLQAADSGPIINLVNRVMVDGVRTRASDIHFEPQERRMAVRVRVDGVLHTFLERPVEDHLPISSRIKVMAGLDIAEKRLPQDGAIRFRVAGRAVDARVSTIPTVFGERVVLRLLDKERGLMRLDELGLNPDQCRLLESEARRSSGILLATGPTGSGKTTTLYAILRLLTTDARNILTIEDPVEYQIPGVNQIQVHPQIGMTFAQGLRSCLRQDPDVMMVGEIRDLETAEIAVRAALTGHLVLSTLHTIDSFRAVTRLIDIGVQPFLLGDALNGVLAQRLVRTVCPHCAEPVEAEPFERVLLEREGHDPASLTLVHGKGCDHCFGTGFRGRTSLFEILVINDEIRECLSRNGGQGLAEVARKTGTRTLRADGFEKAVRGVTTLREVLRVLNEGEA